MSQLIIRAGDFTFGARFEEEAAPKTCAAFKKAMPFVSGSKALQASFDNSDNLSAAGVF